MAYLHLRNPNLDDRFDSVATQYMRLGEAMGLRWDMAFFQMVLETGALSFTGDVRADQNNFAGLGAASHGQHGERFADIPTGVKAHLQHLLMYAGEHVDNPVAERTRKVQEWGVLTDWQNSISGPMTFTLLAQQWAPGSRGYVSDIAGISEGFYDTLCNAPDPRPELVQEARKGREPLSEPKAETEVAAAAVASEPAGPTGAEIARRSIEEARKEDAPRASLGAGMFGNVAQAAKAAAEQQMASKPEAEPAVTLLNPSKPEASSTETAKAEAPQAEPAKAEAPQAEAPSAEAPKAEAAKAETAKAEQPKAEAAKAETAKADTAKAETTKTQPFKTETLAAAALKTETMTDDGAKGASIQTASVAGAATQLKLSSPPTKSTTKCKVWTASYGGQRAILIKADAEGTVNYTVLDVNEAAAKREVDAYIAAYAKGGEQVGSFSNQTKALDKAFELCPEG